MTRTVSRLMAAAILMAGLAVPAFAQNDADARSAEDIAREYMAHYSAVDIDAMQTYWADEVAFSDPTALGPNAGPDGLQFESGEEAAAMLRNFVEQNRPIELGFVWDTVFESNGRVVFMGEVNALYPTQTEGQIFRWSAPQVTVITIRDGQVVSQVDYADYDDADRSIVVR